MNRDAILNMLQMQHRMNTRVHEDWINQHFEWYRATWIECGELMDHVGYKWWKKQTPDMEQVRLEVVDIWHFGLSALFESDTDLEVLAGEIAVRFCAPLPLNRDACITAEITGMEKRKVFVKAALSSAVEEPAAAGTATAVPTVYTTATGTFINMNEKFATYLEELAPVKKPK